MSFGCFLYAASWRSPTASKNSPVAHTTTPATTIGHHATVSTAPTITGPATNHWTAPCTRKTRRTTTPMPIWEGGPPSISAYRGSSLPPCSPTARPRMCQARRSPQAATIAATSQRRQPVPSSVRVPTTAAARAISTKPAPQATSTTAALSSCLARTAAAAMPTATASRPARRAMRTGGTARQLPLGWPVGGSCGGVSRAWPVPARRRRRRGRRCRCHGAAPPPGAARSGPAWSPGCAATWSRRTG